MRRAAPAAARTAAGAGQHVMRWGNVGGTHQDDRLKENSAQEEYIVPPRPSMRLITDQFAF